MAIKRKGSKFRGGKKAAPDARVWHAEEAAPSDPKPKSAPVREKPRDRPVRRDEPDAPKQASGGRKPRWMQQIDEAKRRKASGEGGQSAARSARQERRSAPPTQSAPPRGDSRPPRGDSRPPRADARPPRAERPEMALPPPHLRLRNVRLVIEYDGSRYAGWQVQPNATTVAGSIEKVLAEVLGEEVRLVGAGRTDEGVHAEGQVANFLTRWKLPADGLVHALNDRLPEDIAIIHAEDVGPEFHARHSATARVYRYHVVRRRSVFMRRRALHVTRPMDLKLMRQAAELIVGMHDFAAFADLRLNQERSTKVQVTYAGWKDSGGQLIFRIAGSHFLPRMVRRLVGCMVRVGLGDLSLETFQKWLESGEGESGPLTAPSTGLVLEHVEYPVEVLQAPKRPAWRDRGTHPVARRAAEALDRGSVAAQAPAEPPSEPDRAPPREPPPPPPPPRREARDENVIPKWKAETET